MALSVIGALIVLAAALALVAGLNVFLLIPIVLLIVVAAFAFPAIGAAIRKTAIGSRGAPSGVPTTSDASYDPRVDPR